MGGIWVSLNPKVTVMNHRQARELTAREQLKVLDTAYRFLRDADGEEKVDCCRRMVKFIASHDGPTAALRWLDRQVQLVRVTVND
jgi:hypothetical protein